MSALTNYAENALIDHLLRNIPLTSPTALYVALLTASATETGSTAAEVVPGANTYERKVVAFDSPTNGVTQNTTVLSWTDMPTVTVSHIGIMDALTGGNMLYHGLLTYPVAINAGEPYLMAAGTIILSLA